ncbi:TAXI family TRAP transporter solute-binding subunit [Lutibaculum baratangense]|uniref:TRAP transporter solute receptor, TAXI family n=1 Tax=Lutibaculum baratangense AMV1 TaxID=631454 RepID=V4RHU8_9HYPH|nr:TAXI family TRAP transporter solute-binding subunit [Lutibaculum baratangense]ESR24884.1 TRAP transporter solute receptor, TAXI family precursor [Lutibaculum baratangense AMV1]
MRLATFALAAATAVLIATPAAAQTRLAIGTTSSSSSHYGYFVAVSQLINKNVEGVEANVVETGATLDNLRRLQRNQVDLGLVTTNVAYDVYNGRGEFEGNAYKPLTLWVYASAPQNVVVRGDAGIEGLQDLAGKPFNPGITGSATESTSEAVFAALGIEPKWARGSTGDIVNQIKDDRVVGYVKSGSGKRLDASSVDIATLTPIEIVGLNDEQAATVKEEFPNLSVLSIGENEAGSGYPAYETWAFGVAAVAKPDLDEEVAYQITKAIVEDEAAQAAAFSGLKGSEIPEMTISLATTPLHPGAIRYYEEIGVEVADGLRPEGM